MSNMVKLIIIMALIIAIPVTVKLVQQQQTLKSRAGTIGNDGPGGCCTPGSPNNGQGDNCRDNEVCDIANGACETNTSCRSRTGCYYNSDCGPGNCCENGQCKSSSGSCNANGAPPCDPSQVSMSVAPNPAPGGSQATFSLSGNQGSSFVGDTWSGGVNCTGGFWGSKTCTATTGGSFTWTHNWKNCVPNNCKVTSDQCTKTVNYTVTGANPTPTPSSRTWIPPTCTNGVFSGCTLTGEQVCNNYGDPGNGIGTVQMWGICNSICNVYSGTDKNTFCRGNDLRPPLCQTTTAGNKTTLNPAESITVTSTANTSVKRFVFAFYNNDNPFGASGNPKPIYFEGQQQYAPETVLTTAQTQGSKTFNFSELSRPDNNWIGQIPRRIQVNGYFVDDRNNSSLPNPACVVNFTLAAAPTPTPTPAPTSIPTPTPVPTSAPRVPGDADDNRCVDTRDYQIFLREAGRTPKCAGWNGGSIVGLEDYNIWYRAWKAEPNICPDPPASNCSNRP